MLLHGDCQAAALGAHGVVGRAAVGDKALERLGRFIAEALDAERYLLHLFVEVATELESDIYGVGSHNQSNPKNFSSSSSV